MFARILEFVPLMEKKDEFIRVVKKEVLPILKKQEGFLEFLPLVPEIKTEKVLAVTLWTDKKELERDEKEWFPRVEQIGWRSLHKTISRPGARPPETPRSKPTLEIQKPGANSAEGGAAGSSRCRGVSSACWLDKLGWT